MSKKVKGVFSGDAVETAQELHKSEFGAHYLVVYPDLIAFREIYSQYIKAALKDNEIVILLPFYETVNDVRRILSEDSACIDVRKYEKEQSLLIADSLKMYLGSQDKFMPFVKQIVEYAKKSGKDGVTVMGDSGAFFYSQSYKGNLIQHETALPSAFEGMKLKAFCLYNMRDYNGRLTKKETQRLLEHHGKTMNVLSVPNGN